MAEPHDNSPLALIRRKEQELTRQIDGARRAAEARIAQARQRATAIKSTAERDGWCEAEAYYRQEIASAEQAAARIKAIGQEEARLLLQDGRLQLNRAVQAIIAFVLPT
ncbi:MAG TPA: V-type ATPase subunit subunit G family protein [Alphaproteobacteria bacterium]|nr:V-type ATPase subunit subunit G family protein [Alphaproteobacteria bacterium]